MTIAASKGVEMGKGVVGAGDLGEGSMGGAWGDEVEERGDILDWR